MIQSFGIPEEMKNEILKEVDSNKKESPPKKNSKDSTVKKKKRRKEIFSSIKAIVNQLLTENNNERYYNVCESLVSSAETGNLKAIELIRDLEKEGKEEKDSNGEGIKVNISLLGGTDGVRDEE